MRNSRTSFRTWNARQSASTDTPTMEPSHSPRSAARRECADERLGGFRADLALLLLWPLQEDVVVEDRPQQKRHRNIHIHLRIQRTALDSTLHNAFQALPRRLHHAMPPGLP